MRYRFVSVALGLFGVVLLLVACEMGGDSDTATPAFGDSGTIGYLVDKAGQISAGQLHNEILEELRLNHDFETKGSVDRAAFALEIVAAAQSVYESHNLTGVITEETACGCIALLDSAALDTVSVHAEFNAWTREIDFTSLTAELVARGVLSSSDATWANTLYQSISHLWDPQDIGQAIFQHGAAHGLPIPGTNLFVFYDTLIHSLDYWSSVEPEKGLIDWIWSGPVVIVADAAGAWIGIKEGYNGILTGAVTSAIVYMMDPPEDDGG